jgi:hypothetical protein
MIGFERGPESGQNMGKKTVWLVVSGPTAA